MPMPRVLHVDDDPTVRRAVRRLFESSGWRVASAQNAAEVDDALARGSFDVAVIDLVIGEDDGLELIDRLARRDPELVLVLFSGTLTPALEDRALALGAARCLPKSAPSSQLVGEAYALIGRSGVVSIGPCRGKVTEG